MSRKLENGAGKPREPQANRNMTGADVPPIGAVGKANIKAVDLEPRSNGETEWQDEIPAKKDGRPSARR